MYACIYFYQILFGPNPRVLRYIDGAEAKGAKILLDGRAWADRKPGTWVGPTIILHTK